MNFLELPIFKDLDKSFLERISKDVVLKKCTPKNVIFDEGTFDDFETFFLKSGIIIVTKTNRFGLETAVDIKYPSDFFGWASIIDKGPRTGRAVAITNCEYWVIPASTASLLLSNIDFTLNFMPLLTGYIRKHENLIKNIYTKKSDEKILSQLFRIGVLDENNLTIKIHNKITHSIIGSISGVSRETVTRVLNKLKKLSIVSLDNQKNLIVDMIKGKKLFNEDEDN